MSNEKQMDGYEDELAVCHDMLESLREHYNDQGIELADLKKRHHRMQEERVEYDFEQMAKHEALKSQLTEMREAAEWWGEVDDFCRDRSVYVKANAVMERGRTYGMACKTLKQALKVP